MKINPARRYDPEFKKEAVSLALRLGSNIKAAESLGISPKTLSSWVIRARKETCKASPTGKSVADLEKELAALKKENRILEETNIILKKATAFFSQDQIQRLIEK